MAKLTSLRSDYTNYQYLNLQVNSLTAQLGKYFIPSNLNRVNENTGR